jgi:hypothetical protein
MAIGRRGKHLRIFECFMMFPPASLARSSLDGSLVLLRQPSFCTCPYRCPKAILANFRRIIKLIFIITGYEPHFQAPCKNQKPKLPHNSEFRIPLFTTYEHTSDYPTIKRTNQPLPPCSNDDIIATHPSPSHRTIPPKPMDQGVVSGWKLPFYVLQKMLLPTHEIATSGALAAYSPSFTVIECYGTTMRQLIYRAKVISVS